MLLIPIALLLLLQQITAYIFLPQLRIRSLGHAALQLSAPRPFQPRYKMQMMLTPTDEEFAELLDDMIYSGDIEGFLRKKSKDLVNEDFVDFLQEKYESLTEDDERQVVKSILDVLNEKLRLTDGLEDSELIYEKRLDKIVFTAPQLRKQFIDEHLEDMTEGFVDYVKREMKNIGDDLDSKVVLASILQLIGSARGTDLLGQDAAVLALADESLGDQFKKKGVLSGDEEANPIGDKNEQILAGLMFSQNDLVEDILTNLHLLDEEFTLYLKKKIEDVKTDLEERAAMSSLLSTIGVVRERVEQLEQQGQEPVDTEPASFEDIKQRMREVQAGSEVDSRAAEVKKDQFVVQGDKEETFQRLLSKFLNLPPGSSLADAVDKNYELCDYEFLRGLEEGARDCQAQGATQEESFYRELISTINKVMVKRLGNAQERLSRILAKGEKRLMIGEAVGMTRRGEVDEALILLLEGNLQQAERAGAKGAVEVLAAIRNAIRGEQERTLPDEQKLLRQLLRTDRPDERKGLLFAAFKPSKGANSKGEITEGPPIITPPVFINLVRTFIEQFGNVDGLQVMSRAQTIIDEAQVVATELYGEGMTPRDQQRYMFEKQSVSVWDLAAFEEEALMQGQEVPWRNDEFDSKGPEDVLGERVKRVGGMDG